MSVMVTEITGNPNPKAVTFEVNADLISGFSKLIITRTGKLLNYSPLAQTFYTSGAKNNGGDLTRIDLTHNDGKTRITLSRKLMDWDSNSKKAVAKILDDFFKSDQMAVHIAALSQNIQTMNPFAPTGAVATMVSKTFNEHVSPALAQHGGAIEILDVTLNDDNKVTADIALIGSCHGCDTATSQTLKSAKEAISAVFLAAKEAMIAQPEHRIHKIFFGDFKLTDIPDIALKR